MCVSQWTEWDSVHHYSPYTGRGRVDTQSDICYVLYRTEEGDSVGNPLSVLPIQIQPKTSADPDPCSD
jgi:hypothetical protein